MTDSWATLFDRGSEYDVDIDTVRERYETQQTARNDPNGIEGDE
jgi:hypothetical protein